MNGPDCFRPIHVSRELAAGLAQGFPEIRLGLRSSGGVHVDIAIEVQIEFLENRDQGFDVIVRRFARSGIEKSPWKRTFSLGMYAIIKPFE